MEKKHEEETGPARQARGPVRLLPCGVQHVLFVSGLVLSFG